MEVDAQIVALHVGIDRWCTPSFAGACADAERARKKEGPYGVEAGMTVTIPAIGKAGPVVHTVAKMEDDMFATTLIALPRRIDGRSTTLNISLRDS